MHNPYFTFNWEMNSISGLRLSNPKKAYLFLKGRDFISIADVQGRWRTVTIRWAICSFPSYSVSYEKRRTVDKWIASGPKRLHLWLHDDDHTKKGFFLPISMELWIQVRLVNKRYHKGISSFAWRPWPGAPRPCLLHKHTFFSLFAIYGCGLFGDDRYRCNYFFINLFEYLLGVIK